MSLVIRGITAAASLKQLVEDVLLQPVALVIRGITAAASLKPGIEQRMKLYLTSSAASLPRPH